MKAKLFFLLIKVLLVFALLLGALLVLASLQSFETQASYLNQLAADGDLESFNRSLYQALRLPLGLVGTAFLALSGFLLFRWERTKAWLQNLLARARFFFSSMLSGDLKSFGIDIKNGIAQQGLLTNLILLGVMFVAAVIRLANVNLPLGHDEAYMYNAFASRSFWHIVSNYHLPNNHVLLSIVIKIITKALGNHVWTLRLPTIVAGILMVPAIYFFGKRFYSKETALLSSILVAMFPVLVQYSILARGYIVIGLITVILFVLGDYVRTRENRFAWFLIVLLSALGLFTIPIMLFPFGALYVWTFASWAVGDTRSYQPKSTFLKYWLASGFSAALVTIVLYTPIMIYSFDRFFGNGFIAPVDWDWYPITLWTRLRNTWMEWTLSIPIWLVLIGLFGFLVALIFHKSFSRQKFPPQLAFILWIGALLLARRPDMLPRFWLFLAAPLLVWCAAGIVEPLKRIPFLFGKRWNIVQVSLAILFLFVLAQSVILLPSLPANWKKKDDLEQATLFLMDQVHQKDLVTASVANLPALRYYFNYYDITRGTIRQSGNFQHAYVIIESPKQETLESIAPQLGFGVPAIDMATVQIVYQVGGLTVYEAGPIR